MVYEMARDFHSRGSESFGSKVCSCIWCMICIGPILTVIGLALLVSSLTDTRSPNIELYNDDITAWNNQYETEFKASQNVQWQYNFSDLAAYGGAIPSTTTDTPLDDTGKSGDKAKIATYQPFLLKTSATLDYSYICNRNGCSQDPYSGEVTLITNSGREITITQAPLERHIRDASTCNSDEWDNNGSCIKYFFMTQVCVKVMNNSGIWEADTSTSGNAGCGDEAGWFSTSYKKQYLKNDLTTVKVDVLVRSNQDPRVKFYEIVGAGSALNFGLSQMEKALMGIVLLSLGAGITCSLIAMVKYCMKAGSSSSTTYVPVQSQPVIVQQAPPTIYAPGTYNQGGQPQGYYPPQQQQYQAPMQQGYPQQGYPQQQQQSYGGYN